MSYYADPDQRARLIAGLHDLAIFLEANQDVPVPLCADLLIFPPDGTDAERRTEIDAIAARIGKDTETTCGHYITVRRFGPVEYRAVAIPRNNHTDGREP